MHVHPDSLRQHLDYSRWADSRLLEAATALTAAELTHDFGTADRSVLGTLQHICLADLVWMERMSGRMSGTSLANYPSDAVPTLEHLKVELPAVQERWRQYAAGLTEDAAEATVAYRDLKGREHATPVWVIILHVVNHATHHRGQISGFLRALGRTPPVLDLIHYCRQLPQAAGVE